MMTTRHRTDKKKMLPVFPRIVRYVQGKNHNFTLGREIKSTYIKGIYCRHDGPATECRTSEDRTTVHYKFIMYQHKRVVTIMVRIINHKVSPTGLQRTKCEQSGTSTSKMLIKKVSELNISQTKQSNIGTGYSAHCYFWKC